MSLFLRHDQSAVATEAVMVKIIQNCISSAASDETLPLLLKHVGGLGTSPAIPKAAEMVEAMKMLLDYKPACQVTADVPESTVKRQTESSKLVKLLLSHNPKSPVSEATIMAAIGNGYPHKLIERVLTLLLHRNHELKITKEMQEAAYEIDDMELLLQRPSKEQKISPQVLEKPPQRR
jgi:hypothetical protein